MAKTILTRDGSVHTILRIRERHGRRDKRRYKHAIHSHQCEEVLPASEKRPEYKSNLAYCSEDRTTTGEGGEWCGLLRNNGS